MKANIRHRCLCGLVSAVMAAAVGAEDPVPDDGAPPIGLTIIGYDVENDATAQQQFQAMIRAVEQSGAPARIVNAGVAGDALAAAMQEALADAVGAEPAGPELQCLAAQYRAGEKMQVRVINPPAAEYAWIGFYRIDAADRDYIKYNHLRNIDDNVYEDVIAPDEPGMYNFRVFEDESYVPVAVSAPVEVR